MEEAYLWMSIILPLRLQRKKAGKNQLSAFLHFSPLFLDSRPHILIFLWGGGNIRVKADNKYIYFKNSITIIFYLDPCNQNAHKVVEQINFYFQDAYNFCLNLQLNVLLLLCNSSTNSGMCNQQIAEVDELIHENTGYIKTS